MADPMMLPSASEGRPCTREATTTTSCNNGTHWLARETKAEGASSYLFPFCAGSKQRNNSIGNPGSPRYYRGVVYKLVCAELKQERVLTKAATL